MKVPPVERFSPGRVLWRSPGRATGGRYPRLKARAGRKAFSLAEVAIAVGITSVAVLVVLSLNATGLNTFRDAISDTACARIAQAVTQSVALGEFDGLTDAVHHFDADGMPIASGDPNAVYDARIRLVEFPLAQAGADAPNPAAAQGVRLELLPSGTEKRLYVRTFLVARSGKLRHETEGE